VELPCEQAKAMVEILAKRIAEQKPEPPPPPPTCEPA
jgi:hypothetical protein